MRRRGTSTMKLRGATRLSALVGAALLVGGVALSAGSIVVQAQTGTATPAPTVAGPTPATNLGGPAAVPSARFSGTVTLNGQPAPTGATVVASIGGVACGFGTVTNGSYIVDIQAIAGCTTPGATVSFTVNGVAASQTGTLPALQGSPVILNLTAQAASPTTAPTPTRTMTPPPPPPTVTHTATATPARTPTAQAPAQKPSAQKPAAAQAPAAQKPAAAPAGVKLPSTGVGGASGSGLAGVGLLGTLLGAVVLTLSGVVASRRGR